MLSLWSQRQAGAVTLFAPSCCPQLLSPSPAQCPQGLCKVRFVQGWQQLVQVLQALAPSCPAPEGVRAGCGSSSSLSPSSRAGCGRRLPAALGGLLRALSPSTQWSDSAGIRLLSILSMSCFVPQTEVCLDSSRDSCLDPPLAPRVVLLETPLQAPSPGSPCQWEQMEKRH